MSQFKNVEQRESVFHTNLEILFTDSDVLMSVLFQN